MRLRAKSAAQLNAGAAGLAAADRNAIGAEMGAGMGAAK